MTRTWFSDDTELPACSVACSGRLVTVGTYKLCDDNTRQGRLLLYTLHTDQGVQCVRRRLGVCWLGHDAGAAPSAQAGGEKSWRNLEVAALEIRNVAPSDGAIESADEGESLR